MKEFQKIFAIFLVCGLFITGCDNSEKDKEAENGGSAGGTSEVNFDISDAKTIYGTAADDENSDESVLYKIKNDRSVESIMDTSQFSHIPDVWFIAKSPKTKDIFVAFRGELMLSDTVEGFNGVDDLGNFFHIRQDGSVTAIMSGTNGNSRYGESFDNWASEFPVDDMITFDNAGNLYFTGWKDWYTPVVYKYNLVTGSKTELFIGGDTSAGRVVTVEKIKVSSDGSMLFAYGLRNTDETQFHFLDVISTTDAANRETVFDFDIYNKQYTGQAEDPYFTMTSWTYDPINNALYISGGELSPVNPKDTGLFKVSIDGNLNCTWATLAVNTLDGTDDAPQINNSKHLNVSADGRLWGVVGQGAQLTYREKFSWLSNSIGEAESLVPAAFQTVPNGHTVHMTKTKGDWIYYSAAIESWDKAGSQELLRFNINSGAVENLFTNVPASDVPIRIWSIEADNDYAYFYGSQGEHPEGGYNWISGKINLMTQEYTELDPDHEITSIMSY